MRSRPKTAYRPQTSKPLNRNRATLFDNQNKFLKASPYTNTIGDVRSTAKTQFDAGKSEHNNSVAISHKTAVKKSVGLRTRSKTQQRDKVSNYVVWFYS